MPFDHVVHWLKAQFTIGEGKGSILILVTYVLVTYVHAWGVKVSGLC
jgi:hypothetical protein